MATTISFLHAADLHLDSPFTGLTRLPQTIFQDIRNSTFKALDRLVETAIHKKVDFILLVGDLFDQERHSLKAQVRLREAFRTLQEHHIDVFLSYGNHDFMNGHAYKVDYPDNVHIFASESVETISYKKDGEVLASIHGFSYVQRDITENKVPEYQIKDHHIPWHIAMLHGSLATNTVHDTYAPFRLHELIDKGFDYWALGHIHQRAILHQEPYIVYPGNIQGRHRKEMGEKGCYHVVMSPMKTELTFIPLHVIEFQSMMIDVTECDSLYALEKVLYNYLSYEYASKATLIDLTLHSKNDRLYQWYLEQAVDDLIDMINDTLTSQDPWWFIYDVNIQVDSLNQSFLENEFFIGELSRQSQLASIKPYINELFRHKQGRKYLSPFSEVEEEEIRREAEQWLIQELLRGGEESGN